MVGLGAMGSRHSCYLKSVGCEVLTVDSNGSADVQHVAHVTGPASRDAWIVATPTGTHLEVVNSILQKSPYARILLEKPACSPEELPELMATLQKFPGSRVVVNDIYAHSPVVETFSQDLRRISQHDSIDRITIEFTKNRRQDVDNGRFVDLQYGEVGYEWFHMLSLLRAVLPPDAYEKYLRTNPSIVTREMRVTTFAAGLPKVELYASTDGRIGFPELAKYGYSSGSTRDQISTRNIPYGSSLRYRFVNVRFISGAHKTLVFEPHFNTRSDYKNIHAIYTGSPSGRSASEVTGNQLEISLKKQLDILISSRPGYTEIRLPEHQNMANLVGMLDGVTSSKYPNQIVKDCHASRV
ncbi:Gfo/Idh/MocA family oxidoreductase [Streptomyces muensis]